MNCFVKSSAFVAAPHLLLLSVSFQLEPFCVTGCGLGTGDSNCRGVPDCECCCLGIGDAYCLGEEECVENDDPFWLGFGDGADCASGPAVGTIFSGSPRSSCTDAPAEPAERRLPTSLPTVGGFCGSMYMGVAVGPCSSSSLFGGHWKDPPTTFIFIYYITTNNF